MWLDFTHTFPGSWNNNRQIQNGNLDKMDLISLDLTMSCLNLTNIHKTLCVCGMGGSFLHETYANIKHVENCEKETSVICLKWHWV